MTELDIADAASTGYVDVSLLNSNAKAWLLTMIHRM
jgi:hypothetical protein